MTSTHNDVTPGAPSAAASRSVGLARVDSFKLPVTERELRVASLSLVGAAVAPFVGYPYWHGALVGAGFGYLGALFPTMPERPLSEVLALGSMGGASMLVAHCGYSQWLTLPVAFVSYSVATRFVI